MLELKKQIQKSTIIVGDINNPLSVIDTSHRQKVSRDIDDLNSTINRLNVIDIYRILHAALSVPSAAMAHSSKKDLKGVATPKHWTLDKLSNVFAPCPSTNPHNLRECFPLIVFVSNRLKYPPVGGKEDLHAAAH